METRNENYALSPQHFRKEGLFFGDRQLMWSFGEISSDIFMALDFRLNLVFHVSQMVKQAPPLCLINALYKMAQIEMGGQAQPTSTRLYPEIRVPSFLFQYEFVFLSCPSNVPDTSMHVG